MSINSGQTLFIFTAPEFQTSPVGQCIKITQVMMKRHDFPIFIKLKRMGNHKLANKYGIIQSFV